MEKFIRTVLRGLECSNALWLPAQILETKARFIEQFMTGQVTGREMDDVSQTVLSMGEIKALASGNPKIITRVTLQNEIGKLEGLHNAWLSNRREMSMRIRSFEQDVKDADKRVDRYAQAIRLRDENGDGFKMTIRDQTCYERKVAGDLINRLMFELMKRAIPGGQTQYAKIGEFRGFGLTLRYYLPLINATVDGTDASVQEVLLEFDEDLRLVAKVGETGMGTIQSIESILRLLEGHKEKEVLRSAYAREQIESLSNGLKENWGYEARFIAAKQELVEVEKQLVGQGVVLSGNGEVTDAAPMGENGEHVEMGTAPVVAAPEAVEKIDENFDLNTILARIREIHANMPIEIGSNLVEFTPIVMPTMVVSNAPVDAGMTWDEWLAQQGVPLKPLRSRGKAAIKVQENQMALF